MSVAAPKLPPAPATPPVHPPRAAPPSPPPLAKLLATRPERESQRPYLPLAAALLLHAVLLLLLLIFAPGQVEHPAFVIPLPQSPRELPLITLLSPQSAAPAGGAAAPPAGKAPAPAPAQRAPVLSFPKTIPNRLPAAVPPAGRPGQAPAAQPGGTAGAATAAGELRPPPGDARLFGERENPAAVAPMTDQQRLEARLQRKIDAVNDSILAAEGEARRATDWTIKGKDGSEWGISPGKLHLGHLTLPLPIYFEPPPGKRDEVEKRLSEWSEINRAADAAHNRAIFNDRVKAIRERKEKERAEQKKKDAAAKSSSSKSSSSSH